MDLTLYFAGPIARTLRRAAGFLLVVLAAGLASAQVAPSAVGLRVHDLRCDGAENPLGIDSSPPRLSWKLRSDERGQRQTAWQVLVASSAEHLARDQGDVWDSGRQPGDDQLHVPYAGRPLKSSEQVFWKVKVWDRHGRASGWSAPASWTMGVLAAEDWHAHWITDAELLRWVRPKIGYHSATTRDAAAPKWVRVDLGESRAIESVRLYPMRQVIEEAQGFPSGFRIEVSDDPDFARAQVVADHTTRPFRYTSTAAKTTVPTFPAPAGVRGRYVRLLTTQLPRDGDGHYLALSQIEIRSDGRNVAVGAGVSASDSLETGCWSLASVVDGKDVRGANPRDNATLLVRREFAAKPALRRALLHVSGLGHYDLALNGRRAGPGLLSPGWTTYERTVLYDTHDVTALVRPGANAISLVLAGGMYNVRAERYGKFESLFRPLTVMAQLRLEYADGSIEFVGTDSRWRVNPDGPVTFANIYGGEDFDARRTLDGWDAPGFDEANWTPATVHAGPGGVLRGASHAAPPLAAHDVLRPVAVNTLRPGVVVYDFGQNTAMMPRLRVRGPAGASVRMIPAELVKPDGSIDTGSFMRGPNGSWWTYTLGGRGTEEWCPRFFYTGCRYVQVELASPAGTDLPTIEALESVVVHTASAAAGEFACSNDLFNRIRTLIRWAQRSNAASVLTDCPHREKFGWLEQYYLNGPSLRYEFDLARLYAKTFGDMADAQLANGLVPDIAPEFVIFAGGFRDSPEWGSAIVLAAWQQLEWTGDDTPLRRHYPAMGRYADYLASRAEGHILSHGLGDWYDIGPKPPGVSQLTPLGLTATATYFHVVKTLAAIATRLGHTADAVRYTELAGEIRAAFNRRFFDAGKGVYATGSQCANAMPLVLGLVEPAERARVLEAIVRDVRERGLTAGDVGYRYLLRALADGGRSDVIHEMNNQSARPGYGYQLAQGATALTEAWNARRVSSHNHFMLGQLTEWLYRDLAGLGSDPEAPGFKHTLIRPQPVGTVTWARAAHESPRGRIVSSWKRTAGRFELEVEIPVNATATVFLPTQAADRVTESGVAAEQSPGVRRLRAGSGETVYELESGHYSFSAPIENLPGVDANLTPEPPRPASGTLSSPTVAPAAAGSADALEANFRTPPAAAKPVTFWWWFNSHVTRESITHDLEEFHAKGLGGVVLINTTTGFGSRPIPAGPKFLSPEWRELYRHALREANRLGLEVGVNLSTGWCMGGPWIKPEQSGRWLLQSEHVVTGPAKFSGALPRPGNRSGYDNASQLQVKSFVDLPLEKMDYRDTSVIAFPEPAPGASALGDERRRLLAAKSNRLDASSHVRVDEVMRPTATPWVDAPADAPLAAEGVIDLTGKVDAAGRLEWDVPPGRWVILRTGHRMTGARTLYALPEAEGLEVDWLNEAGVNAQFEHLGRILLAEAGPLAGTTLRYFHEDSFEDGFPNWTENLLQQFRRQHGYDATPYLPVFAGRMVGSAERSDRFLYDYRRTVADLMANAHYGRLAELCHAAGVEVQNESAGPSWSGTMCMDALKNLGRSDRPMGEFWQDEHRFVKDGQNQVTKMVATDAHVYGKRTASAEAFTTFSHWNEDPAQLKPVADRAFCEGINRIVFHTSTATHPADGKPGNEYGAGTHFNPNITWWEEAGPWVRYLSRCAALLQAGTFVADVLYYNGDGAPNLVPHRHTPADLGPGYDYDVCNTEVLLTRVAVQGGRLVLPDGISYRLLVLPDTARMPVRVARKIRELVAAGATVIGPQPDRDPGLADFPRCDEEVRAIGREVWGKIDGREVRIARWGDGRVVWGHTAREVLAGDGVPPDFAYDEGAGSLDVIHRRTPEAEVYFVVNRNARADRVTCTFRVTGGQPELWDPVTGEMRSVAASARDATTVTLPIDFAPHQSWFVVFRSAPTGGHATSVSAPVVTRQGLNGAWDVAFDPKWGGPANPVRFASLTDWIQHRDERIRFYSGTAVYRKEITVPEAGGPAHRWILELGTVKNIANVCVNGRPVQTVWCAPWECDLTAALRPGRNHLEVRVTNLWPNRLIGDKYLPAAQRYTRTNIPLKDDARLLPSGLLGPVMLRTEAYHESGSP